jgi:methionine synthase II (cobalamin-independent)
MAPALRLERRLSELDDPAFRLVHAAVKPTTQIHTNMCYSEFEDIIKHTEYDI